MVFSSIHFIFYFLPLVLLIYFLTPGIRLKNVVLLFFSLAFYYLGEFEMVLLMMFSCIMNYFFGLGIHHLGFKKGVLSVGVLSNLGFLMYFKYTNFFVDNLNKVFFSSSPIEMDKIHLPIGISFFTFQSISYLVDVYRKETDVQKDPIKLSLYVSLFPQLVAGPIVRYHDIATALKDRTHNLDNFVKGIDRFIIGLSKKILIADQLAVVADRLLFPPYDNLTTADAWIGIICYAMQIFFDFSGYSDMAIGLGKMLGFNFLENFNLPYSSKTIQEFWRRWHISLSSWFRDYVYIPLGGNRKGIVRTYINLIIVFFVTGFWHGASWGFIVWGLYHGFFLILERIGLKSIIQKVGILGYLYTFIVVLVGWVFFRVEGGWHALDYLKKMFGLTGSMQLTEGVLSNSQVFVLILALILSTKISERLHRLVYEGPIKVIRPLLYLALFLLSIIVIVTSSYQSFIYFRF